MFFILENIDVTTIIVLSCIMFKKINMDFICFYKENEGIFGFRGEYAFLSNFEPARVILPGRIIAIDDEYTCEFPDEEYCCLEAAYMASKVYCQ